MIMRVLEQNPEELSKLKGGDANEQSVLSIFEKNAMTACCKVIYLNYKVDK